MAKTIYFKDWLIFNSDIVWILEETDKVTKMFIPFLFVSVILTEQKFLFHQCQYYSLATFLHLVPFSKQNLHLLKINPVQR